MVSFMNLCVGLSPISVIFSLLCFFSFFSLLCQYNGLLSGPYGGLVSVSECIDDCIDDCSDDFVLSVNG